MSESMTSVLTNEHRGILRMLQQQHAPYDMGLYCLRNDFHLSDVDARQAMREYCQELRAIQKSRPWWQKLFCA